MAASICIEVAGLASLEIENLACVRGGRLVFRGLEARVEGGGLLAVEGPNGSGKTSLLRLVAGLLMQQQGTVRLRTKGGQEIAEPEGRARRIGWFGHQDGVKRQLTALEQLRFFAEFYGGARDEEAALARVGLSAARDLPIQYLSAGQKKRLALARLQLSGRPLWLLDEPLAALDTQGKSLVADLIGVHCAAGGIAVAATHESLGMACERLHLT
jgi:heme exporter protein A